MYLYDAAMTTTDWRSGAFIVAFALFAVGLSVALGGGDAEALVEGGGLAAVLALMSQAFSITRSAPRP